MEERVARRDQAFQFPLKPMYIITCLVKTLSAITNQPVQFGDLRYHTTTQRYQATCSVRRQARQI
jgi:hypothetical protein